MHSRPDVRPGRDQWLLIPEAEAASDGERSPAPRRARLPLRSRLLLGDGLCSTTVCDGDLELCLLGSAVDYEHPRRPLKEVLADVAVTRKRIGPEGVAAATRTLGGRWLLLWSCGVAEYAFLDPVGMRRLFSTGRGASAALASDPRLLPAAADELAGAAEYAALMPGEYWWPGPVTPIAGVRQLAPNHVLDLASGAMTRCWPVGPVPSLGLQEAVGAYCGLLRDACSALAARSQGACLGLTAGLDTRVLLAACRTVVRLCDCFTFRYPWMDDEHEDVRVPLALADEFGLSYSVMRTAPAMSAEFSEMYRGRVTQAHDAWGPLAEAMQSSPSAPRLLLKGIPGGEIFSDHRGPYPDERVTPEVLRAIAGLPDVECVRRSLTEWLATTPRFGDAGSPRVTELLIWEQVTAQWQGMSQEEYGSVQETFSPMNCRALYEIAFGVERRFRDGRVGTGFQRALIEAMWPDLLRVPIDPEKMSRYRRSRQRLRRRLPRLYVRLLLRRERRTGRLRRS